MAPALALKLAGQLQGERLDVGAIIAGRDPADPHECHLYRIFDPGSVEVCDRQGFCAIGTGHRQFEAEFMFKEFTRDWPWERALILMYSAKKRAEVSPGVGRTTDFFMIGSKKWFPFPEDFIRYLDHLHKEYEDATKSSWLNMEQKLTSAFRNAKLPPTNLASNPAPPTDS